ncbi:MAG: hypothetical protein WBA10_18760, partial [Elainellaceae cyanobacterium]
MGLITTAVRWLTSGAAIAAIALPIAPALAHQVTVSESVGGTIHIEPNDVPRAGRSNLAWFALTRRGGQTIPLSACRCSVSVYAASSERAIATPSLEAIAA